MRYKTDLIYFSPTGRTEKVMRMIASGLRSDTVSHNITGNNAKIAVDAETLAVFGAPVYSGRLPPIMPRRLETITGNGAAVVTVVYGNRAYDDALLELKDLVASRGFKVLAGAAFVAEHNIVTEVASGRPDRHDEKNAVDFAQKVEIKFLGKDFGDVDVKGNNPYRPYSDHSVLAPEGSSKCDTCGVCSRICPVAAINAKTPKKTDKTKCISCLSCVYKCHTGSRHIGGIANFFARRKLRKLTTTRREPEFFL